MIKKVKVKASKRTIFINKKKYFLEIPELIFSIDYKDRIVKNNKYSVNLYINKRLPLGNIGGYNKKYDICLGKVYFDKENFPNNVIERFFCSRFTSVREVEFYKRWQQYGFDHIKNEI